MSHPVKCLCEVHKAKIWHEAPSDLQRSLYEHFYELLTDSTFGQFLVSTLPTGSLTEKSPEFKNLKPNSSALGESSSGAMFQEQVIHTIQMRNILLDVVYKLVKPSGASLNQQACEDLIRVLGFDWLMLFLQSHVHSETVILALRLLLVMFRNLDNMRRFREGSYGGGWMGDTENVLKKQMSGVLGFNVGAQSRGNEQEISHEVCHVPGFQALQWLLGRHTEVPDIYFLLMALLLGQQGRNISTTDQNFNVDSVWSVIFGVAASKPMNLITKDSMDVCPDAALVLLAMIRNMTNEYDVTLSEDADQNQYPVTVIQFLMFLYHNMSEFQSVSTSPDFLAGLVATLFPFPCSESSSNVTTPSEEYKAFPESESAVVVKITERECAGFLTGHPARRFIIDFIRSIIIDSLSQGASNKGTTVMDLVLDGTPDHVSRAQQRQFQTEMLNIVMEHLLAADVLLGEQAALPLMGSQHSYSHMAASIFYLASRIVDKMWHGVFTREAKEVFDFLSKLIAQAKRKSTGLSLEPLYKCLNRTILFQLSRPINSIASQASVLDALHVITNNRNLVFGPGNHDTEFLGCLCFCLLQLTDDPETGAANLSEPKARATTWHVEHDPSVPYQSHSEDCLAESQGNQSPAAMRRAMSNPALVQGMQLVSAAAKRVWDELYIYKKPALEDLFRVQFNNHSPAKTIATPELNSVRLMVQEPASKIWVAYAEAERKSTFLHIDKLQNQIQSKLQKVGSGVTGVLRLASRRTKRDLPLKSSPVTNIHVNDFHHATLGHIAMVKDVVQFQHDQYLQASRYMEKYLLDDWAQIERELLRVRSLWGPPAGSRLDKMVLDMTEGPFRMRKKMMRNDMFYIHYPYRPNLEESPLRYKVAISFDSKDYYEHFWPQGILAKEATPIQGTTDTDLINNTDSEPSNNVPDDVQNLKKLLPRASTKSSADEEDIEDAGTTDSPHTAELDRTDSTVDRPEVEGQGENNSEIPPSPTSKTHNQAIVHFMGEEKISHLFRCARIQGLDTAEGLLLFGKEQFFIIDGFTLLRTKEIKDIDSLAPEIHDPIIPKSSMGSSGSMKRMYSRFAYDDIREVHQRRYLLQPIAIEVFSGDGRNHLLAFPRKIRNKVLAKFLSVATEMTDNAHNSVSGQKQNAKVEAGGGIISNLIGEKSVTQRWEKGEISNFQYLMHLNTLAGRSYNDLMQYPVFPWIIANYDSEDLDLTKTANFRDLSRPMGAQTPDRLQQFQKRYNEWDDPQGETPPYHYGTHYSSAMIVASYLVRMEPFTQHFLKLQGGHFDLADRMFHSIKENWLSASKNNMADVKELIPEFYYLPDFLLNKNNFDLGSKQNGVALGDVILPPWAKGDPREFIRMHRQALECDYVSAHLHEWIDLIFGYKQCGPPAVDAINVFHHLFYEGNVDIYNIDDPLKKNATIGFINNFGQIPKQLFKKPHPQKRLNIPANPRFFHHVDNLKPAMQPVKELKGPVGQIHHTEKYLLAVEQNKVLIPPSHTRYLAWGFSDLSVRIGPYESEKAISVFEGLDNGEILCASCPTDKIFITGGTSCVVNVWEYSSKERRAILKRPLYGHTEPVTCLTSSAAYSLIVSGSRDRTCILWDLSRLTFVHQLRGHVAPVAVVAINDLTGDIATCAGTFLHVWNVNGEAVASVNTSTGRNQQILCVSLSQMNEWDNQNVILTGSSDGVVRMWSVEYVQVPKEESPAAKSLCGAEATGTTDVTATSPVSEHGSHRERQVSRHSSTEGYQGRRRLSRHESCDSYSDGKSAADILKDFKDPDYLATIDCGEGIWEGRDSPLMGSGPGSSRMSVREDDEDEEEERAAVQWERKKFRGQFSSTLSSTSSTSDLYRSPRGLGEDNISVTDGVELDKTSVHSGSMPIDTAVDALAELGGGVEGSSGLYNNHASEPDTSSLSEAQLRPSLDSCDVKFSQSESNLSDFEVISVSEVGGAKNRLSSGTEEMMKKYKPLGKNCLREGFCWQRQLVFRSKLTMHTAFERKDNKEPAAITAIAISKDHKIVYVGDVKGRIWNWTVTSQPGRVVADHWVKDDGAEACPACGVRFSFSERRHHCRNCGNVFCSKCSSFETDIQRRRITKPVRVCQACYNIIKAQQECSVKA
ncbi:WD repeat and FYVE domain-containing protein 3 [Elysia marginata]|uniref:WD repeat and FYVE domain-containing protein 3 n=1 Tax=Elysia marginata TaxID=1093978 RepID=A0AAV4ISA9_9GAST|nr:WD repeat and FYVE domain-containing protein 3 [Elysia marginata]